MDSDRTRLFHNSSLETQIYKYSCILRGNWYIRRHANKDAFRKNLVEIRNSILGTNRYKGNGIRQNNFRIYFDEGKDLVDRSWTLLHNRFLYNSRYSHNWMSPIKIHRCHHLSTDWTDKNLFHQNSPQFFFINFNEKTLKNERANG